MTKETQPDFGIDVLAVAPHPDDVELSCGGTLAKLSALGYRTGILDLTRGELSSAGDLNTRATETEKASKVLGLSVRENLEFPDGWIDSYAGTEDSGRGTNAQVSKVVAFLRERRPEILLIPYHTDRHPDHSATHDLLRRAIFLAGVKRFPGPDIGRPYTPRQTLCYQQRQQFTPSVIVDVSSHHAQKLDAVRCYSSQIIRSAETKTLLNSPLTLTSLEARDRLYGAMIGVEFAEPFLMTNAIGLADPIEHFRRNPYSEALFFPEQK